VLLQYPDDLFFGVSAALHRPSPSRNGLYLKFEGTLGGKVTNQDLAYALRGALAAPVTKSRAAITSPDDLGGMPGAIECYDGQSTKSRANTYSHVDDTATDFRVARRTDTVVVTKHSLRNVG
jgi:hypothetical protein